MYKLQINPLNNQVLGFTKIASNIPVYNDDLLVEDIDKYTPGVVINPETLEVLDQEAEVNEDIIEISKELREINNQNEHDYLMQLIVDEEKDLDTARAHVIARRNRKELLGSILKQAREQKEKNIQQFYLEQNKVKDALINPKYYSAVIMVIKHENRYLKEWIDWHLAIGFDHIYLYDNGTEEKVAEIVGQYPLETQAKVTITDWSAHHVHLQQNAYEHFMDNFKQDVRWGIFIDSDEFVRFTDGVTTNVNDFLKNYEDYTEIWGYEVEYNANGQESYEDKPVRERFTQQTDARKGFYWKNFVQPNRITGWLMHYAQYNPEKHMLFKNKESNQDLFVIDHYYTKSWEEWIWKIKDRGGADPKYHKALSEFFYYNPDMTYLDTGEEAIQAYEANLTVL